MTKAEGAPKRSSALLSRLGLERPDDFVLHLPLRYEDETRLTAIRDVRPGEPVQVEGVIAHSEVRPRPRRQLAGVVEDAGGSLFFRFLNFYPSQQKQLAPGRRVRMYGELRFGPHGPEMVHPRYRVVDEGEPLADGLTPIYPTTAGLGQAALRRHIGRALEAADLSDTLPPALRRDLHLPDFGDAARLLHAPPPDMPLTALEDRSHPVWRRLIFDELLAQQLSLRLDYRRRRQPAAPVLDGGKALVERLLASLPFSLTAAQRRVTGEILADLAQPHPMQRLLQGDVGSGKTVVAAIAALQCIGSGWQAALMAPTEILAEQHYQKLKIWLDPLGIRTVRLAARVGGAEKRTARARLEDGEAQLAIGTHAVVQDTVRFARLGLAIVDEQHRFGVRQRLALKEKGVEPHQLMMSATPIPRTLAMSYCADLDVSAIDSLPPGRKPVATRLVADSRRDEVLTRIREACRKGAQVYWVCPLIEESENEVSSKANVSEANVKRSGRRQKLQLQTAIDTHARLREALPEFRIGLVHGRLSADDKAAVMAAFQHGEIQLLVATTVIEVGVDVPNASLMVIEHAERMGLAQLHQLRGRVGRGSRESTCILMYQQPLSETARERLRIVYENQDGFEIARHDLRLRGPGELLGARQAGVPTLRFADLERDRDLLEKARRLAPVLIDQYPEAVERHLARWLGGGRKYLEA
jgi:ATP-dependent DNA helicase RecG